MKNPDHITSRYAEDIAGVLNCFDRVVLFGTYLPICHPDAMSWQLHESNINLIDYEKKFANKLRLQIRSRINTVADKEHIQIQHVCASQRKETLVSDILAHRGDAPGIVCILSAMEKCSCYKVGKT